MFWKNVDDGGGGTQQYYLSFDHTTDDYAVTPAMDINGSGYGVVARVTWAGTNDLFSRHFAAGDGGPETNNSNGWNTEFDDTKSPPPPRIRNVSNSNVSIFGVETIPADTWLRIIITGSGDFSSLSYYADDGTGTEIAHADINGSRGQTASSDLIWFRGDARSTSGNLSEVACYDRQLSSSEQNAYATSLTVPSNPIANYPLNDGSGTTATDVSGNGNDATIVGADWVAAP